MDKDMYFKSVHMLTLISKQNEKWTYSANGSLEASLRIREANEIPGYFFKDDALLIHGPERFDNLSLNMQRITIAITIRMCVKIKKFKHLDRN